MNTFYFYKDYKSKCNKTERDTYNESILLKWRIPSLEDIEREIDRIESIPEKIKYLEELSSNYSLKRKMADCVSDNERKLFPRNFDGDILNLLEALYALKNYWKKQIEEKPFPKIESKKQVEQYVQEALPIFPMNNELWENLTVTLLPESEDIEFKSKKNHKKISWEDANLKGKKGPLQELEFLISHIGKKYTFESVASVVSGENYGKRSFHSYLGKIRAWFREITGKNDDPFKKVGIDEYELLCNVRLSGVDNLSETYRDAMNYISSNDIDI